MPNIERPNILLVLTDQQSASAMGCAGSSFISTPNLDRLASQSVRFDRAYCTQPLCVPSRASLVTGRFPHEIGVPYNLAADEAVDGGAADVPWFGRLLRRAGYHTAWIGKWHLPAPTQRQDVHGFDVLMHARGNRLDADVPPSFQQWLADAPAAPFFVATSFVNPHDCCQAARGDELPNGPIDDPPAPEHCPPLPDNFEPPPGEPTVLRDIVQPSHPDAYPTVDWDPGRWRQYRWQYDRLVEKVDRQIGSVLDALQSSGRWNETLIIFTSDHGDGRGAHRWNQKQVLYDEVARVPLLIKPPGGASRGGRVDADTLVSMNLDVFPTLCDYVRIPPPAQLQGLSLRPVLEGVATALNRDAVFCETEFGKFGRGTSTGVKGRLVRTQRYAYLVYSQGEHREQLFEMDRDPGQMRDLTVTGDADDVLHDCRRRLHDWCAKTGDDFPVPNEATASHGHG